MSKSVLLNCGREFQIELPDQTDVLNMKTPEIISHPREKIINSLHNPIESPSLSKITKEKIAKNPDSKVVIVISDSTRPVPYKGEKGILLPIIEILLDNGVNKENILILVATGTHRPVSDKELKEMIDSKIFELGIEIRNHDCNDDASLISLGKTSRGTDVYINKHYMEADLKILTGLVESHFMAGTSGGRKSVCPGIIGEKSTYVFHSAEILSSPNAQDLVLEENPCHQESLEVAKMAGVDFIVNVTLDEEFNITGVFSGDLEKAHQAAVENIKNYVAIPVQKSYDIVITHAGFVGINHYQSAKAGVVAMPLLKPDSKLIMAANTIDDDPVGSIKYKTVLYLLKKFGAEKFEKLILSPNWGFIPEQWQVQMWAKMFKIIPQNNFLYYSPQLELKDYENLPGLDGNQFLPSQDRYNKSLNNIPVFIKRALDYAINDANVKNKSELKIAYLIDGPYGVPINFK